MPIHSTKGSLLFSSKAYHPFSSPRRRRKTAEFRWQPPPICPKGGEGGRGGEKGAPPPLYKSLIPVPCGHPSSKAGKGQDQDSQASQVLHPSGEWARSTSIYQNFSLAHPPRPPHPNLCHEASGLRQNWRENKKGWWTRGERSSPPKVTPRARV